MLQLHHRAENLPFLDGTFACVAAFLCDPFLGLDFVSECYRVLQSGGVLFGSSPSLTWGKPLRDSIGIDLLTTRFISKGGEEVRVASHLFSEAQIIDMLAQAGFPLANVKVTSHCLPPTSKDVSPDITRALSAPSQDVLQLPILTLFSAKR